MRRTGWQRNGKLLFVGVLGAGLALAGGGVGDAAQPKRIAIIGGQVGGAFNFWTNAMAPLFSKEVPGLEVSVEASTGSPENIRRVNAGEVDMGFAFSSDLYEGYRALEKFAGKPQTNVRALSFAFGSVGHFVVLKSSPIRRLEDIAGKRLAAGGPGSGSALAIERLLRLMGLWEKVNVVYLGGNQASQAIKDGKIDAYNWHPGIGNATILDTAATHDIRLIDLHAPAKAAGLYEKYPYFTPRTIPAGTYRGINEPVATFQTASLWIAHKTLSPDLVYQMLKVAYSEKGHQSLVTAVGKPATEMTLENALEGMTVPLHAGAARFYEEKGKKIPPEIAPKP